MSKDTVRRAESGAGDVSPRARIRLAEELGIAIGLPVLGLSRARRARRRPPRADGIAELRSMAALALALADVRMRHPLSPAMLRAPTRAEDSVLQCSRHIYAHTLISMLADHHSTLSEFSAAHARAVTELRGKTTAEIMAMVEAL